MRAPRLAIAAGSALLATPLAAASPPIILTDHAGYEPAGPKGAVVQGHRGDVVRSCVMEDLAGAARVATPSPRRVGAVDRWRDWRYWTVDFSSFRREGTFRLACATAAGVVRSLPFRIEKNVLERHTLSDVVYYFKGQRSSGASDQADRSLSLEGRDETLDAHGGWHDATGDYGKHLSHLSSSTYFNPQQLPLTAWALLKAHELLQRRGAPDIRQYLRRLMDEGAWGADYLVRVKAPGGSFYRSVSAPGPEKRSRDRRVGRDTGAGGEAAYQSSLRAGGGMAIAALARAAAMEAAGERSADYLRAAEEAWAFLAASNARLTNDGRENIVDDYCALLAATELFQATRKPDYKSAADERARRLMARLAPAPQAYWRADPLGGAERPPAQRASEGFTPERAKDDRPFFHAADAGLPVVSLLCYLDIADPDAKAAVLDAVRASLEWEMAVSGEVANPFGYARQLVQTTAGVRETRFFYPHDTETAPWWQGENARLASLAFAARLAIPRFARDAPLVDRLRRYAQDQLDWILGRNPFDACMLQGQGHNNPEYLYFGSPEYTNAPGGIVNGITAGFSDPHGIDFNLPHAVTGADNDWRWGEQWLPHASWYLLAVAAGSHFAPAVAGGPAIIAYLFPKDGIVDPATIAADELTHINYAFANVADGRVVEGFAHDAENFRVLAALRRPHPHLKVLVSVGGWTWSGAFSDAALTPESRRRFVQSAVEFVRRHDLDGLDVDWEYPGLPGNGNVHRPEDKQGFTSLMAELRAALDAEGRPRGRHYLLSFAAGAFPDFLLHTEMDKVQSSVDFVNLMAYDFRESGGDRAGHHANLYVHPADDKQLSADRAVRDFLAAGVPPAKLVLGVPFYGRAWGSVEGSDADGGLYRPAKRLAERIDTHYAGLAALVDRDGYRRRWDRAAQAPFLWNGDKKVFVSYEDPESLQVKSRYIVEHGLGGAMFWEYYADPTGALLGTLFAELRGAPAVVVTPEPSR